MRPTPEQRAAPLSFRPRDRIFWKVRSPAPHVSIYETVKGASMRAAPQDRHATVGTASGEIVLAHALVAGAVDADRAEVLLGVLERVEPEHTVTCGPRSRPSEARGPPVEVPGLGLNPRLSLRPVVGRRSDVLEEPQEFFRFGLVG